MNKDQLVWARVGSDLKVWIIEQAEKDGRSISSWISRRLWEYRELSRKDEVKK